MSGLKVRLGEIEVGLDIEPETGAADSGDIGPDLADLFEALGEAAKERNTAVAILIDEIQYLSSTELGAVIMAILCSSGNFPLCYWARAYQSCLGWLGNRSLMQRDCSHFPMLGRFPKKTQTGPLVNRPWPGACKLVKMRLGSGSIRSRDIATCLGTKLNSLGPVRMRLIKKGMIYSPAYGDMAFTVPLFDEFMKRAIPNFDCIDPSKLA